MNEPRGAAAKGDDPSIGDDVTTGDGDVSAPDRSPTIARPGVHVSVVIPTLNGAATIGEQLRALITQQTTRPFEVVVVDNGSTDGTAAVVAGFTSGHHDRDDPDDRDDSGTADGSGYSGDDGRIGRSGGSGGSSGAPGPVVRLVSEPRPGLNRARNAGTAAAAGEIVLLCDCDDVVRPGWVEALSRAVEDAGTAGGVLALDRINSADTRRRWQAGTAIVPGEKAYGFLPAPYGANCGYRVDVWRQLGGFDEEFTMGGDDFELFWRAQLAGHAFVVAEDAVVDYRLRVGHRHMWRRQYRFGKANVQVYAAFRDRGLPRSSTAEALRAWAWAVVHALPAAVSRRRRGAWVRAAARRAGRVAGSLSRRTLYL